MPNETTTTTKIGFQIKEQKTKQMQRCQEEVFKCKLQMAIHKSVPR